MTRSVAMQGAGGTLILVMLALPLAAGQTVAPDADGFIVAQPEDLAPPEGSRSVRILGDPGEPGRYVMRVTFAPGTGTRPHFHDQARQITVIEGTWWVALGPDVDVMGQPVEQGTGTRGQSASTSYCELKSRAAACPSSRSAARHGTSKNTSKWKPMIRGRIGEQEGQHISAPPRRASCLSLDTPRPYRLRRSWR